ncbi:S1C family serine protease [Paenibacillus sp. IHBB 10380]|uniref:S1C family serine protease n=1 Tax=Paenibacillus sp. IHBB 10380 TaxID=1566358 RepID=UPI0005CFE520|nr:trypsin-like peptidase domain-containing protein [Paenibacillus sp. IHBB 10380]AJS60660.1 serine protease [Paenibacillus sp. IHBB 10380]
MGLFDDEFYSTKVSRPKKENAKVRRRSISWPRPRRRLGLSTLQISLISSVVSAFMTVLLISLITGLPTSPKDSATVSAAPIKQIEGDPFERLIQAAAKVRPAVVSIVNYKDHKKDVLTLDESGVGSGVIYKQENGLAYIITNHHVINEAEELEVITVDGEKRKAKLIGTDPVNDIAVLSIDDKNIKVIAEMGDSDKLRLGETVIAIGNPLGLGDTLTSGIISYTNRMIPVSLNQDGVYDWEQKVIQTDAAINEGNSGGALVDLNGKVIGINTMKISDTGVEGLSFAIPMDQVMKTAGDLMENGKISRSYLGVYTVDLNNSFSPIDADQRKELKLPSDVKDGVLVLDVVGPALDAGMKLNDVITQFNGKAINKTLELKKFLYNETKVGDELTITYYREGELKTAKVLLKDKPELEDVK